jgi:nickel-dependent lactate racemase
MAKFTLPYGKSELDFTLPDDRAVDVIRPPETPAASDPIACVKQALQEPVGGLRLEDFREARRAVIAINDKTRPVPHHLLLPPLLEQLESMGLSPESITLLIATGVHPPMPPEEFLQVLPETILSRYPVFCHDGRDESSLVHLGQTQRGTPVWVNRLFYQADLRIVIGNIEPHQFQGFSGGVKSAAIGLAGPATINHNHALMTDPGSRLGEYEHNPARQDVEEIGDKIGVHFALNAILNEDKEIVQVLAGDPRRVMQVGIPLARRVCQVTASQTYSLLIASPGGHPKDINLYQAQKGLYHASLIVRPGGTLILAAACPEGTGSSSYENWVIGKKSYQEVFERFAEEGFRVGPHKAYQIARDASKLKLRFLSEMAPDFARSLLLEPISDLQQAVDEALSQLPSGERIAILPQAVKTIPEVRHE